MAKGKNKQQFKFTAWREMESQCPMSESTLWLYYIARELGFAQTENPSSALVGIQDVQWLRPGAYYMLKCLKENVKIYYIWQTIKGQINGLINITE